MYLKKGLITALRIKNILLLLFCAFEFVLSTTYIISEFSTYSDSPEYAWGAVSMKSAIVMTCVAVVLLIAALLSIKHVGNAVGGQTLDNAFAGRSESAGDMGREFPAEH